MTAPNPFSPCKICPRSCGARREREERSGFCATADALAISSICVHTGEEPVISGPHGICNVFFAGCNLRCVYCQNREISRSGRAGRPEFSRLDAVVARIGRFLDRGCGAVGFVSPSHAVPHVMAIVAALRAAGRRTTFVYNTNAYDRVETIAALEPYIDVYLPDFKYADESLGRRLSLAPDYPRIALAALDEMYAQKGTVVELDEHGVARKGVIVRHLVLPGQVENSLAALRLLSEEFSPHLTISLMSQYYPTPDTAHLAPLDRTITPAEYEAVLAEWDRLGFDEGWVQELDSHESYRPDFSSDNPFHE